MSLKPDRLLIVAASARALAQSAGRGGWRPLVIDGFLDRDTQAAAHRATRVNMEGFSFDEHALLAAAQALCPYQGSGLVYGGGIESNPELLEELSEGRRLLGNTPATLRRIKDPRSFFALLDELDISHPAVRYTPPSTVAGWLRKNRSGTGGAHVFWPDGAVSPGDYFQQYVDGQPMSVLFLANGRHARLLGFNLQRSGGVAGLPPFIYTGAIGRVPVSASVKLEVAGWITKLVRKADLRGLNSLDFVLRRGRPLVLEINPRPSATCELYEPESQRGLLHLHILACIGSLPGTPLRAGPMRGHHIVYADEAITIPELQQWPLWTSDLPAAGTLIHAGQPVCSVHAEGRAIGDVERILQGRHRQLLASLTGLRESA